MIIDAPAVDWLTFTTYENDHYLGWKDWQRKLTGEQKTGKIRMYDGGMDRKFICWGRSSRISASWPYKEFQGQKAIKRL